MAVLSSEHSDTSTQSQDFCNAPMQESPFDLKKNAKIFNTICTKTFP